MRFVLFITILLGLFPFSELKAKAEKLEGVCNQVTARVNQFGSANARDKVTEKSSKVTTGEFVRWKIIKVVETDRIPLQNDSIMYFSYKIDLPPHVNNAKLTHLYIFPSPGMIGNDGQLQKSYENSFIIKKEETNRIQEMYWTFDANTSNDWLPGYWKFQVWNEGCMLLDRDFNVYRPKNEID